MGTRALTAEARALAPFRHPGLVTVRALGCHERHDFIVMELLSSVTLAKLIEQRNHGGEFGIDETIDVLLGIADALGVLHNAGLAHRDLKPDNIMLGARGRIILVDLGIMRLERDIAAETSISGTPLYIAPESIRMRVKRGQGHLVDLYALGVIAYEMLMGQPPFTATKLLTLFANHLSEPPVAPGKIRRDVPPALSRLIVELLEKSPDDRPPSIDLVVTELRAIRNALYQPPTQRPIDVLVVDDDAEMRALVHSIVCDAMPTARVRVAENGEVALREFRESPPDVMFLDLDMPVMSGMEVCMFLRGTNLADHTTIVVLSAHAEGNEALLHQLGIADVLAKKGAGLAALTGMIRNILTRTARSMGG